ncbi:MAG TPA: ABC transporter permease [Blastocatellia bacterium]|nr:ABC transporter permease [Blastocatellia bacterium]
MASLWFRLLNIWLRLYSRVRRGRTEEDIKDELQLHLELLENYHKDRGLAPAEARQAAHQRFGDIRRTTFKCQAIYPTRKGQPMDALLQDLRYGIRLLIKHRGFTIVAILSLALGIGVNTAMFSFVDAILIKTLDYPDSDRLVQVWESSRDGQLIESTPAPPTFFDWREQNRVFSQMSGYTESAFASGGDFNMAIGNSSERIISARVSANFFDTMGIHPSIGRAFEPGEDQGGLHNVAVITNRLWRRVLVSDPNIIGKTINLNEDIYTVVGVLPADTIFERKNVDVYLPLYVRPDQMRYTTQFFQVYARLKPGVTLQQASDNMKQVSQSLEQQGRISPNRKGAVAWVEPLRDSIVSKDLRKTLWLLMGAVLFILLIACVNVANLLLARSATRAREVAIRAALGAGRLRLLRQMMAESLLLSGLGGVLGLLLSFWLIRGLTAIMPRSTLPVEAKIGLDYRVLLFTLGISMLTGILSGLLPALQATRPDLIRPLQDRELGSSTLFRRNKSRTFLLISEIALCFILVIGATLMIRSFATMLSVDPGFRPDKILTMKTYMPAQKYPQAHQLVTYETELLNRVRALPGVKAAGVTNSLPITGRNMGNDFNVINSVEGKPVRGNARIRIVTPEYFSAVGMRLLKGRLLSSADTEQGTPSVVVNQSLAHAIWNDKDPLGEQITISGLKDPPYSIVGVVDDTKHNGLTSKSPLEIYIPLNQISDGGINTFGRWFNFAIRTEGDPMKIAGVVQSLAADIDKGQPLYDIQTMDQVMSESVAEPRFDTLLFTIFGALALVLAAVGIYGVMAYSVTQRIKEIGIRMALGAESGDIFRLIVSRGLILALIGIVLGVGGAISLTRYLSSLLFEIKGTDPMTFVSVAALMIGVALLACYVPARRATKVDPMITLRYE